MSRIRTVKPEFWADEKLAPLDPMTRLVFLGLISMADDRGRLVDNIKQIDAFVFSETTDSAAHAIDTLAARGRILRGVTASGQKIIELVNWHHQKIDRPNYPACLPEIKTLSPQEDADFRRKLDEASTKARRSVDDEASNHINDLLSVSVSVSSSPPLASKVKKSSDAKYPHFVTATCDAGFEHWIATHGSVEYSVYRKSLGPSFRGLATDPTTDQLIAAQTAHQEAVEEMTTKDAGFENIHKFAGRLTDWLRLGAMPWTDEWGVFTERGRVLGSKAIREQQSA